MFVLVTEVPIMRSITPACLPYHHSIVLALALTLLTDTAWAQTQFRLKNPENEDKYNTCQAQFNGRTGLGLSIPRCIDEMDETDPSVGCDYQYVQMSANQSTEVSHYHLESISGSPMLVCRGFGSDVPVQVHFRQGKDSNLFRVWTLGNKDCVFDNKSFSLTVIVGPNSSNQPKLARYFFCRNPSRRQLKAVEPFLNGDIPPRVIGSATTPLPATNRKLLIGGNDPIGSDVSDVTSQPDFTFMVNAQKDVMVIASSDD
jgi:hypothetical protein